MPTDTDSSEIATIRAAAQFEAEKKQEKLKSFDFVNRWIEIRQLIFGKLPDVKGEKPNQLIRDAVNNDYYPRPELVAELYLPNFAKLVDEYEAKILNLNEPEKTRAGLRLCAVIVHIGLKIHQAIDGNRQTTRALATSYLQELTEHKNKFLPIKYAGDHSGGHSLGRSDTDGIVISPPEAWQHTDDERLYQIFTEACNISGAVGDMTYSGKVDPSQTDVKIKELSIELAKKLEEEGYPLSNLDGIALNRKIIKHLSQILSSHNHGYIFTDIREKHDLISYYLTILLTTQLGQKLIKHYIETGEFIDQKTPNEGITSIIEVFSRNIQTELNDFSSSLESSEAHDKRHQDHANMSE